MTKQKRLWVEAGDLDGGIHIDEECGGVWIQITKAPCNSCGLVFFTATQWAELNTRIRVEDVPEPKTPGQRLTEALDAESVSPSETYYDRVAARLGIKSEGE